MDIRHSFSVLPPLVRQLLGAAGGALIAVLLYVAFQYVPSFDVPIPFHGSADPVEARDEKLDRVAEQARALLEEMEANGQMP